MKACACGCGNLVLSYQEHPAEELALDLLGADARAQAVATEEQIRGDECFRLGWVLGAVEFTAASLLGFASYQCLRRLVGLVAGIQLARRPA